MIAGVGLMSMQMYSSFIKYGRPLALPPGCSSVVPCQPPFVCPTPVSPPGWGFSGVMQVPCQPPFVCPMPVSPPGCSSVVMQMPWQPAFVCPTPVSPCLQAWAPVGMHKYHSFIEYVQLYPEYDFIMLGDNGQGDAMCADRVIMKAGKRGWRGFMGQ